MRKKGLGIKNSKAEMGKRSNKERKYDVISLIKTKYTHVLHL